ncbi:hypothetical protein [uncultured Cohaesibacter sp.]|uniref:hypothetical protein n=1 Tax=uncultured Cohaesibacter sp. TaxID=1002546 RepID=UPI002AA8E1AC|nr:hypothetical protein [uncultured Cohaesibacter sp.]
MTAKTIYGLVVFFLIAIFGSIAAVIFCIYIMKFKQTGNIYSIKYSIFYRLIFCIFATAVFYVASQFFMETFYLSRYGGGVGMFYPDVSPKITSILVSEAKPFFLSLICVMLPTPIIEYYFKASSKLEKIKISTLSSSIALIILSITYSGAIINPMRDYYTVLYASGDFFKIVVAMEYIMIGLTLYVYITKDAEIFDRIDRYFKF